MRLCRDTGTHLGFSLKIISRKNVQYFLFFLQNIIRCVSVLVFMIEGDWDRACIRVFKYVVWCTRFWVGVCLRLRATENGNVVFTVQTMNNQCPIYPKLKRWSRRWQAVAREPQIAVTSTWYGKINQCWSCICQWHNGVLSDSLALDVAKRRRKEEGKGEGGEGQQHCNMRLVLGRWRAWYTYQCLHYLLVGCGTYAKLITYKLARVLEVFCVACLLKGRTRIKAIVALKLLFSFFITPF